MGNRRIVDKFGSVVDVSSVGYSVLLASTPGPGIRFRDWAVIEMNERQARKLAKLIEQAAAEVKARKDRSAANGEL